MLEIDPHDPHAHYNVARALRMRGATAEALGHLAQAQGAQGLTDDVVRMRVTALIELERYDEAVAVGRAAAEAHPASSACAAALGFAYQKVHEPAAALACYERAASLGAGDAGFFNNRGIVLQDLGRFDDAFASYDRALAIQPDHALTRFHRALAQLLTGAYEIGWTDYEARLASREYARPRVYPRWDGTRPAGRKILVYAEQGLGDEIMFASCLPDLIQAGARCRVECSPKLVGLLARSFPEAAVYAAGGDAPADVPDVEVPIGSLPLHYRRSLDAFPRHGGYLKADPARVERWRAWLDGLGPGMKIGLSWKGGTHKTRTSLRSLELDRLLPLLTIPGTQFVSLQYTPDGAEETAAFGARTGVKIAHSDDAIADYEDTAALVSALDLTLTVCTAVVHLTGALGRDVWVAAPCVPEWRYGAKGERMPWYPSARVFRQPTHGAWDDVIKRMTAALTERLRAHGEHAG